MEKRFILWLVLSFALITANMMLIRWLNPPAPPKAEQQVAEKGEDKAKGAKKGLDADAAKNDKAAAKPDGAADAKPVVAAGEKPAAEVAENADKPPAEQPADANADQPPAAAVEWPRRFVTLGSADPDPKKSSYRELVTITTAGAAVKRVELNNPKYLDQEDRSGYWGHLELAAAPKGTKGAVVQAVGAGTPAAEAGLRGPKSEVDKETQQLVETPGDLIVEFNGEPIETPAEIEEALLQTQPGTEFTVVVDRAGKRETLSGTLRRRPMEVIRPEGLDPLSFLLTMESIDEQQLPKGEKAEKGDELPGLRMRTADWQLLPQTRQDAVEFRYDLVDYGLYVIKRFRLAEVDPDDVLDPAAPAYHMEFDVEVHNLRDAERKVAWRLDGPTGLPMEGASYKISPNWRGGAGMRDVVVGFVRDYGTEYGLVSATTIADEKKAIRWQDEPLEYLGVDTQYYAAVLLPTKDKPDEINYAQAMPIVAGEAPEDRREVNRTDVTFRWISAIRPLPPQANPQIADKGDVQKFRVFVGPKKPEILAQYGLKDLVYYGLSIFGWVASKLRVVLHIFYSIIPNYGIAIILLTVLVRSMLFPLSRKQALNAQKMQELQPEIKRIQEKYKGNMEARTKAQQELFKKHNYNPLAGCLPVFLQLPIFIGLYRCLSVDAELNGAPLISSSIRWCSNLAAPDMLWKWQPYLPEFLAGPHGFLGPYFNILPCITIALFLWQQKMFLPPPTDEQAAMQQKVMKYMMVFIGVMFFKVPSGLCLYFIASSLWGIAERKLLPKPAPAVPGSEQPVAVRPAAPRPGPNGSGGTGKKKNRGRI